MDSVFAFLLGGLCVVATYTCFILYTTIVHGQDNKEFDTAGRIAKAFLGHLLIMSVLAFANGLLFQIIFQELWDTI